MVEPDLPEKIVFFRYGRTVLGFFKCRNRLVMVPEHLEADTGDICWSLEQVSKVVDSYAKNRQDCKDLVVYVSSFLHVKLNMMRMTRRKKRTHCQSDCHDSEVVRWDECQNGSPDSGIYSINARVMTHSVSSETQPLDSGQDLPFVLVVDNATLKSKILTLKDEAITIGESEQRKRWRASGSSNMDAC
ncbi:hypothetical protein F4604DRAFT_1693360 [Suillus subluteus]|nr:hypothetical protein F4604DRAFT_1693360 [Suillus subluteus]